MIVMGVRLRATSVSMGSMRPTRERVSARHVREVISRKQRANPFAVCVLPANGRLKISLLHVTNAPKVYTPKSAGSRSVNDVRPDIPLLEKA